MKDGIFTVMKKVYDITKELLSCEVYQGDKEPVLQRVMKIQNGEGYNLSNIEMCLHNGTHMDAPYHFIEEGKTIDEISLEEIIGICVVARESGVLDDKALRKLLDRLKKQFGTIERLLLKGEDTYLTLSGAKLIKEYGICLVGVERDTVGNPKIEQDIEQVHKELLGNGIVILEHLDLSQVEEKQYILFAQPLKIKGADAAPCRAILMEKEYIWRN